MTVDREPLLARNFRVRLILHGPRGGRGGEHDVAFSSVVMPPFLLDQTPAHTDRRRGDRDDSSEPEPSRHLMLRRGHTGSNQLFDWWRAERDAERFRVREVMIAVLDQERRPTTAWHFTSCRIVSLSYSPLDALAGGVLIETLELSFGEVDQVAG